MCIHGDGDQNRGASSERESLVNSVYQNESAMEREKGKGKTRLEKEVATDPAPNAEEDDEERTEKASRRKMKRAEAGILRHMNKLMSDCNAKGFVYGIIPFNGRPVTGSSDSLKTWWREEIDFEENAPIALAKEAEAKLTLLPSSMEPPPSSSSSSCASSLCTLELMQDTTLATLISAMMQHCNPPQRRFPLNKGETPPWWPTGKEEWWGEQGYFAAIQGPPPYRKPHDLKKAWKVTLLAAVIKHIKVNINDDADDKTRQILWRWKKLQDKMSATEIELWSKVIDHEVPLLANMKIKQQHETSGLHYT